MPLKVHVGFPMRGHQDMGGTITEHFTRLGYHLAEQAAHEWVFQRGKKLAALWAIDIRSYLTTLRVQAVSQSNGNTRFNCDWEVWTFVNRTKDNDILTLEAEGRQLKAFLRERATT
jgi:hypothetical protein